MFSNFFLAYKLFFKPLRLSSIGDFEKVIELQILSDLSVKNRPSFVGIFRRILNSH